jgi:hypothetical protein
MDYFTSHIVNHLTSRMITESSGSSCPSKSSTISVDSSIQDDIRQLEDVLRTYSYEPDTNSKSYNMRTLLEMTHEQLIHMTQEEIKNIFQMLCRELTTTDYFCVKVGTIKDTMANIHSKGTLIFIYLFLELTSYNKKVKKKKSCTKNYIHLISLNSLVL